MLARIIVSMLVLTAAISAHAGKLTPRFDTPPFAITPRVEIAQGNGCPSGTATASISPDGKSLSILFDNLVTNLPAATSVPTTDYKVCLIRIYLKFAGQYRVAIVGSDVRGFANVPANASTHIRVAHYPVFSIDPNVLKQMNYERTINGPSGDQNLLIQSRFPNLPIWSYCGTQMNGLQVHLMAVGLDIKSMNASPTENLIASFDSMDISASGLTYQLAWTEDKKGCPK